VEIALGGDQRSVPGDLPEHMDRDTGIGHPGEAGVAQVVTAQMLVAELGDDLVPVGCRPPRSRDERSATCSKKSKSIRSWDPRQPAPPPHVGGDPGGGSLYQTSACESARKNGSGPARKFHVRSPRTSPPGIIGSSLSSRTDSTTLSAVGLTKNSPVCWGPMPSDTADTVYAPPRIGVSGWSANRTVVRCSCGFVARIINRRISLSVTIVIRVPLKLYVTCALWIATAPAIQCRPGLGMPTSDGSSG
jgi:hypothetical protein